MSVETDTGHDLDVLDRIKEDVADAMNSLYDASETVKMICENNGWNDAVAYDLREGIRYLGIALAGLTTCRREVEKGEVCDGD